MKARRESHVDTFIARRLPGKAPAGLAREVRGYANRQRKPGLSITVCHFPPGTSKWNKIEHRLFSYIAMNWRGRPLTSLATKFEHISRTVQAFQKRL